MQFLLLIIQEKRIVRYYIQQLIYLVIYFLLEFLICLV